MRRETLHLIMENQKTKSVKEILGLLKTYFADNGKPKGIDCAE